MAGLAGSNSRCKAGGGRIRPGPTRDMGLLGALALLLLAMPQPALACGQSTHIWAALHALEHLPEGSLKELVTRDDLLDWLVNGAMFPDGGYSPLSRDAYGESAHWEPFQTTYLEWIGETQPAGTLPWEQHLTLDLGMAAHGIADQVFDGIYLTRSQVYDAADWNAGGAADTVTDVAMVSQEGAMQLPADVVPYDELVGVFERYGYAVEASTIRTGQASLRIAVSFVGGAGSDPEEAAKYTNQFPWANENLTNPDTPGSPACIGEVIAAYWQVLFERAEGRFNADRDWVIHTFPADGSYEHPTDALDLESQLGLVFARAIEQDTLTADRIVVTDSSGVVHPTEHRLYYGNRSNVLNLWPVEDWAEDETYTVTVKPGLRSFDGVELGVPWSWSFSTGPAPEEVEPPAVACGCASTGESAVWLGLLPLWWRRRR